MPPFTIQYLQMVLYPAWAEIGAVLLAIYGAGLAVLLRATKSIVLVGLTHACLTDLAAIILIIALYQRMGLSLH